MSRHSDRLRTYGMFPDRPRTWMDDALCGQLVRLGQADPDWWVPDPSDAVAVELATAICQRCPVRAECAADGRGQEGVWGGRHAVRRHPRTRSRRTAS